MSFLSSIFGKNADYLGEYKRFKKAMGRTSHDQGLKTQFIKFCLMNRFTKHEAMEAHVGEALALFDSLENAETFDLQCHYLVGKYYQEIRDYRRAYRIYLNAIKRFNHQVGRNPTLRSENEELAYSMALNLMTLQSNPVDLEVETCFKIIRRSFPLHLKRIELENEMAKPAPDKARIKQLAEEVRRLKEEEDKETEAAKAKEAPAQVKGTPATAKTTSPAKEEKGLFSKLFNDMSPVAAGPNGKKSDIQALQKMAEQGGRDDFFKIAPSAQDPSKGGAAYMAYHNEGWEGPFTAAQLRSLDFLKPDLWVCRVGSENVIQASDSPDLQALFHPSVAGAQDPAEDFQFRD